MGISRDSRHKRSATGAKRSYYRKKRAFEKGRQPANTRIGAKRIHLVRTRGGNQKYRALRLDSGNFSWGSEGIARKVRVISVTFHPSNNELVRTNTLTKSAVVQVDAAPFRQWYEAHYGQNLGRRRQQKQTAETEEKKKSKGVEKKQAARYAEQGKVDPALERQFEAGRLYAVVASRPGQSGRVDGYVLEGDELAFYQRAIRKHAHCRIDLRPDAGKMTSQDTKTVKTRFCIISDTHTAELWPFDDTSHAYRDPLPSADVLLHAGDITNFGYIHEYETMVDLLSKADAQLKIVIAGNHDVTLDEEYYESTGKRRFHRNIGEDLTEIKELWTGEKARKAGIVYLEEGIRTFTLTNGARFTIYTSPYQPEFCDWAFPYYRNEDRFNPGAKNPIPDWPHIDIMLTHGPPAGVLDETNMGDQVGCEHLMRAVRRCRPRLHCFGHIHEGWGAQRTTWAQNCSNLLTADRSQMLNDRCVYVDLTKDGNEPLAGFGEETLFVNAAIMNLNYESANAPWRSSGKETPESAALPLAGMLLPEPKGTIMRSQIRMRLGEEVAILQTRNSSLSYSNVNLLNLLIVPVRMLGISTQHFYVYQSAMDSNSLPNQRSPGTNKCYKLLARHLWRIALSPLHNPEWYAVSTPEDWEPQATGSLFLDPHSIPGYGVGGTPTDEHPYRGNIPDIEANPEWSQAIREAWLFHCFAPATADEFIAMHTESRKKLANAQETHEQQMRGLTDSKAYQCILRRKEQDLVETSPDDKETHEDLLRRLRNNRDEYQHLAKQIFETREIGEKTYAVYVSLRKRGQEIIDTHKNDVRISREDSYNVIDCDGGAKPSTDGLADAQKVPEHVATDDQGPQRSAAAQERSPR
ncbi:MAG: hypothetical protein Q9224_002202 [Gallowayella concinna]